jgi:transcriptional regulator with XRE-family HTH domain
MNVGTKIDKLMKQSNVAQETLASNLGVTQKAIHDIISGKTKKIDFLIMHKICDFFNVDFNYFLEEPRLKQVNKDRAIGYIATNQSFYLPEKLIEHYEKRIEELKEIITHLKK